MASLGSYQITIDTAVHVCTGKWSVGCHKLRLKDLGRHRPCPSTRVGIKVFSLNSNGSETELGLILFFHDDRFNRDEKLKR